MRKRMVSITEKFADYIIEIGAGSSDEAVEGFAALLLDGIYNSIPELVLTDDEEERLMSHLTMLVEELVVDADSLVSEWNRDARESYQERGEARRGQY